MAIGWMTGALLVSAGPVTLDAQEVDQNSVIRSAKIMVDSLPQARYEAGELVAAVKGGTISWEQVTELRQVVAGQRPGRESSTENIFVKHFWYRCGGYCSCKAGL